MFPWDLMVMSRSLDFLSTEVEGWLMEGVAGSDSEMDFGTFPLIFLTCDGIFFLEGTSRR